MSFDPLIVWLAAACTAVLFAHAALAKLADLPLTEQHLHAYGVPAPLLGLASRLLPALELLAAVAVLTPWRELGAALAVALLLAYAAAMAWHRWHGHALDCGCGGEPLALSWALVARNGMLALLAAAAGAAMQPRSLSYGDFFVIAAGVGLGSLLYAAFHQVLRHRARIAAIYRRA